MFDLISLRKESRLLTAALLLLAAVGTARGQQTTSFTYQGRLTDGGTPANGSYDLQFAMWDSAAGGTQIGSTQTVSSVSVSSGIFTVTLDFGGNAFTGADRFLEISARASGSGSFTLLSPRQQITSTPYAVRSRNASSADALSSTCSGCVSDTNISGLAGTKITGTIPVGAVPGGSGNYIQNTTNSQANSNFNIDGNGTAGGMLAADTVNATTQYNIAGQRVLLSTATTFNTFLGVGTGFANPTGFSNSFFGVNAGRGTTTGSFNSFFGNAAGLDTTTGLNNSFFGWQAGSSNQTHNANSFFGSGAGQFSRGDSNSFFGLEAGRNTTGATNAFFGANAGFSNTSGGGNSFFGGLVGYSSTVGSSNSLFGYQAGYFNTTGSYNSFFGATAGYRNIVGHDNAFFGYNAGQANTGDPNDSSAGAFNSFFGSMTGASNTTGPSNSFFGSGAGFSNTAGSRNTIIGSFADVGSNNLTNATAIGANAFVTQSDSLVLGSINGVNGASADTNVGIGTTNPSGLQINAAVTETPARGVNNVRLGVSAGTPRAIFEAGGSTQWEIDNNAGRFRIFNPGAERFTIDSSGNVGIGTSAPTQKLFVVGNSLISGNVLIQGTLVVDQLGTGGTPLCVFSNELANCSSSSLRYKKDVLPFAVGLKVLTRLQPITFTWKDRPERDLGLGAEDVAAIEPLLTFRNAKGEIEGVKYDKLTVVLINSIKEQQGQIEKQQKQIEQLTRQVRHLRTVTRRRGHRR